MDLLIYVVKTSDNTLSVWYESSLFWLVRKASY